MHRWYESEEANESNVVGGQVCLVRNIVDYPFEDKMSGEQQSELLEAVCQAVRQSEAELQMKFRFLDMTNMKEYEQQALVGRLAVPPQMLAKGHHAGLILSEDDSVSILANGREHLCIQVSCPGLHIQEAMEMANRVDDSLNQYLRYAFSRKYGYLTARPFYMGTGLSASYLLHLPYLEKKQYIGELEKELGRYGFSLRAHFCGQTPAPGSIYRVKNRKTLGLSEGEILSAMAHLSGQLTMQEHRVADQVLKGERLQEVDRMCRAYGILKYAKNLNYDETMEYLSIIHAGDLNGIWQEGEWMSTFAMMVDVDDSVLSADAAAGISSSERGRARAAYIQRHLPEMRDVSDF